MAFTQVKSTFLELFRILFAIEINIVLLIKYYEK